MVIYDGIISSLQSYGGITVYFNEILSRMPEKQYTTIEYASAANRLSVDSIIRNERVLERYRNCQLNNVCGDVFHSTYYRLPDIKKKTVTTVHDFTYEKYVSGLKKYIHTEQKYNAIKKSDKIICVSYNTALDLMRYCPVAENKIHVIQNGVSDNYHVIGNNLQTSNEVVFIGSRTGYKNFDKAVCAVALSPNLELVVVGGGPLNKYELAMLDSRLKGRYSVSGKLSDEDLNILYNTAYCLLYPSDYEGFGIPVLEAMKAGCPVVAVNRSSIPEVAGNAAILVDNSNPDTLHDALVNIEFSRNKLIVDGLVQASKFSWENCFNKTLSLYNTI
ncbi:glycosyltransferase family 4 protein [Scandinavium manionii]|uniref:glycosyltransferase family 4 protein n=1 Tax=Scandinavium manionii TaxID=2926520 RepID=UPI0021655AE7|nr:glycosyltransferase family 1 protein [Scandinavium manionii]MCS2150040.1 glycosyltransferase family 4 protein [Scandinavium manionii]